MKVDGKLWGMALFVGVLLVVSLVQTTEVLNIKAATESLVDGAQITKAPSSGGVSSGASTTLEKSLGDLQGMVGGC